MRRLLVMLTAGLALATFGCSSSDTPNTAASTTTSSVVVSAANKPTCSAIEAYQNAAAVTPTVDDKGDPTENAMKIQAFLATLIAPLEQVAAAAPDTLKPSITILIDTGNTIVKLDPKVSENQTTVSKAVLAPTSDVAAARTDLINWSRDNCGIAVK